MQRRHADGVARVHGATRPEAHVERRRLVVNGWSRSGPMQRRLAPRVRRTHVGAEAQRRLHALGIAANRRAVERPLPLLRRLVLALRVDLELPQRVEALNVGRERAEKLTARVTQRELKRHAVRTLVGATRRRGRLPAARLLEELSNGDACGREAEPFGRGRIRCRREEEERDGRVGTAALDRALKTRTRGGARR